MKNKVLLLVFLFITISLIFLPNSFAANTFNVPDELKSLLKSNSYYSNPDYDYILYKWNRSNDYYYTILFFEKSSSLNFYCSDNYYIMSSETFSGFIFEYDTLFNLTQNISFSDANWTVQDTAGWFIDNCFDASFNIYTDNTYTTFFLKAPTFMTRMLEKTEMKEPIITTIVGLAKLLIPLLICLLGFWKAWRLLLKILHKS